MENVPRGRLNGPKAVGLLALNDRKFFAELLVEPEQAMNRAREEKRLDVSDDDIRSVAKLISERNSAYPDSDALKNWDKYRQTGSWDLMDWPTEWSALGRPAK